MGKEVDKTTLEAQLAAVNQQFETVSLHSQSGRLYIKGSGKKFPLKPGLKENPKQVEIPTGCNATLAELKIAKIKQGLW